MIISPKYLWSTVMILGLSFDFLFWKKTPGISFTIFIFLCLIAGISLLRFSDLRPARNSLLLLPPVAFLTVMVFVRLEPMTVFLSVSLTFFLLALFAVTYLGGRWPWYSLPDYIVRFSDLAFSFLAGGARNFLAIYRQTPEEDASGNMRRLWPAARGILLALPILAVLTALLASADLVFSQRLGDIASLFRLENVPEYILRCFIIVASALFLAGIYLHAGAKSRDEKHVLGEEPISPFLGFTEAVIIMGSVVALFAAFVGIQFQYFFGGEKNIDIDGYTYSEYARRGFGELVAVAVFSLLLLILLSLFTRRESIRRKRIFSGLGVGLVALVLVIQVSAFQRILLYEDAYGFSRLRTYTHVFMIWLGLLLVAVILLEIMQRHRVFALAAVLATIGFVVTLNVINVDGLIVSRNVQRAIDGKELDVGYLESLSSDAVPALATAYRSQDNPDQLHDDLGKILAHFAADTDEFTDDPAWQSFHLSRHRADGALNELESELMNYRGSQGVSISG